MNVYKLALSSSIMLRDPDRVCMHLGNIGTQGTREAEVEKLSVKGCGRP